MSIKSRIAAVLLAAAVLAAAAAGCAQGTPQEESSEPSSSAQASAADGRGESSQDSGASSSQAETEETALEDLYYINGEKVEAAFDDIYGDLPELLRNTVHEPDDQELREVLKLDPDLLDDRYIRLTDGSFGVGDIFVVKPLEDSRSKVMDILDEIRQSRIRQYENYDVHDSLKICSESQVLEVNDYLLLIMVENGAQAQEALEKLIPRGA